MGNFDFLKHTNVVESVSPDDISNELLNSVSLVHYLPRRHISICQQGQEVA